jgi:hypothetical protein
MPPDCFAAGLDNRGALPFGLIALVELNDDPVGLPPELVRRAVFEWSAAKCQPSCRVCGSSGPIASVNFQKP